MIALIKKICVFICVCVLLCNACACGQSASSVNERDDKKLVITTTIFPIYDFVKNITKGIDNIEVNMLLDSGIDLHNFQPSAKDIITISNSDMFIYIGGESDEWVESAVDTAANDKLRLINIMQELKSNQKDEVVLRDEPDAMAISGSEDIEEHDHEHEHEDHEHEEEYDEHVWLGLKNVVSMVNIIANNIINTSLIKDTVKEGLILQNTSNYIDKLNVLNEKFINLFDTDGEKVMVVADRFPFLYFCEDYGIKYYAAFKGCSSQSEASFQTIKFLTDKVDEYNLKYIFKIEKSDTKIAETIIENSKNKDQEILVLNSIQQIDKGEISKGITYLSLMEENYNVLAKFVAN